MAFTITQVKAVLSSAGVPVENLETAAEEICSRHKAEMDSLKEERDTLAQAVADADAYKEQLDEANSKLKAEADKLKAAEAERDDFKGKYETVTADFDKLKADNAARDDSTRRESAIRTAAKSMNYSDEAIEIILDSKKDFASKLVFGDDGKPTNVDDVFNEIAAYRPGIVPKVTTENHVPDNPPGNAGGRAFENMPLSERMKYANENPDNPDVRSWLGKN